MLARRRTCKKADKSVRMITMQVISTPKITITKKTKKTTEKQQQKS